MITLSPFWFIVCALAVFRMSYMITHESGPMFIWMKLRKAAKKDKGSSLAEGISCPYCVSIWCSIALTVFLMTKHLLVRWLALIGVAMILILAIGGAAIVIHQIFVRLRRE